MSDRVAYRIAEVARLLGVSRDWVEVRIRRGDIPAYKFGRTFLVPAEVIDRLRSGAKIKKESP